MPKLVNGLPKYRRHSSRDLAFVVLNGQRTYLPGKFGSPESRKEYRRLCLEWETKGRPSLPVPPASEISVSELLDSYWQFVKGHYVKHGLATDEQAGIRAALRPVLELYGETPAANFGPLALKAVREKMVERGLAPNTINKNCSRIRRFFRWAAAEELIPVATWQALATLPGLQRGRTKARETAPVLPVDNAIVERTILHLSSIVADMVRLQRLCGMRPMEVRLIRPCDVDRMGDVWRYVPSESKMEHKERNRVVYIGPQAQGILLPYLLRPAEAFCFSPLESESKRRDAKHAARVTPQQYGNTIGTNRKSHPKRRPQDSYSVDAYRRAIARACEIAFRMPEDLRRINVKLSADQKSRNKKLASEWRAEHVWAPNQLRHAAATSIRAAFGIEAVKTVLGHADILTSQIYAERDEKLAEKVAKAIG